MNTTTTATDHELTPALTEFAKLLKRRLQHSVPTNEDTVRYTFFYALIKGLKLKPEDIMVESSHGKIALARLDLQIFAFSGREYVFEFKYDNFQLSRAESGSHQRAGRKFKDIFRLSQRYSIGKTETIFVYLTSRWMKNYFNNPVHEFTEFFNLPKGESLLIDDFYMARRPDILKQRAGQVIPCTIDCIYSCGLPDEHALRVYRVRCDDPERAKKSAARLPRSTPARRASASNAAGTMMDARTPPPGYTRKQWRRQLNDRDTGQPPVKVASTVVIEEQRRPVDKVARIVTTQQRRGRKL